MWRDDHLKCWKIIKCRLWFHKVEQDRMKEVRTGKCREAWILYCNKDEEKNKSEFNEAERGGALKWLCL